MALTDTFVRVVENKIHEERAVVEMPSWLDSAGSGSSVGSEALLGTIHDVALTQRVILAEYVQVGTPEGITVPLNGLFQNPVSGRTLNVVLSLA